MASGGGATNAGDRRWRIGGALALLVPIAAVGFLIATVVNGLPDAPTSDDARGEAAAVLREVDAADLGALRTRFATPYPPGADELYANCHVIAPEGRGIEVSGSRDFPASFVITVVGAARQDPERHASCAFSLVRKDRHWTIGVR
ncbi:hypothetical protein [Leifsonia naganoensis]|uniref:Uncharacterized protein n=1 Tax=Leifsonia naganoensis TaxID=150025 RepID=A0A853DUH1_9MICO|nr:hypothetical protein [Leifsonia naganoensis]NYK09385.1 hypothetical protein [Leifsonia naganoensis]